MTWDDVLNAYRFAKYNGKGQCVRWVNLDLPIHVNNTNHITDNLWLEFDINYQSTDTSNFIIQRAVNLGGYENTNHNTNCLISNCTVGISRNVWHRIIAVTQNMTINLYCDGELISNISDSLLCYRNYGTLDVNFCRTSVSIGKCDSSSQNNDLYMKDIKLYRIV